MESLIGWISLTLKNNRISFNNNTPKGSSLTAELVRFLKEFNCLGRCAKFSKQLIFKIVVRTDWNLIKDVFIKTIFLKNLESTFLDLLKPLKKGFFWNDLIESKKSKIYKLPFFCFSITKRSFSSLGCRAIISKWKLSNHKLRR